MMEVVVVMKLQFHQSVLNIKLTVTIYIKHNFRFWKWNPYCNPCVLWHNVLFNLIFKALKLTSTLCQHELEVSITEIILCLLAKIYLFFLYIEIRNRPTSSKNWNEVIWIDSTWSQAVTVLHWQLTSCHRPFFLLPGVLNLKQI